MKRVRAHKTRSFHNFGAAAAAAVVTRTAAASQLLLLLLLLSLDTPPHILFTPFVCGVTQANADENYKVTIRHKHQKRTSEKKYV